MRASDFVKLTSRILALGLVNSHKLLFYHSKIGEQTRKQGLSVRVSMSGSYQGKFDFRYKAKSMACFHTQTHRACFSNANVTGFQKMAKVRYEFERRPKIKKLENHFFYGLNKHGQEPWMGSWHGNVFYNSYFSYQTRNGLCPSTLYERRNLCRCSRAIRKTANIRRTLDCKNIFSFNKVFSASN